MLDYVQGMADAMQMTVNSDEFMEALMLLAAASALAHDRTEELKADPLVRGSAYASMRVMPAEVRAEVTYKTAAAILEVGIHSGIALERARRAAIEDTRPVNERLRDSILNAVNILTNTTDQ